MNPLDDIEITSKQSDIIDYYSQLRVEGMDRSKIRKELIEKGVESEKIQQILDQIENLYLKKIKVKEAGLPKISPRIIGIVLVFIGLGITLTTYVGWINLGKYYIFAYGPILTGLSLIAKSKFKRSGMFDRKRRFR